MACSNCRGVQRRNAPSKPGDHVPGTQKPNAVMAAGARHPRAPQIRPRAKTKRGSWRPEDKVKKRLVPSSSHFFIEIQGSTAGTRYRRS